MRRSWIYSLALGVALGLATVSAQPTPRTIVAHSDTLPATCVSTNGEIYFKTGASSGLYQCLATNTWTAVGGSGGDIQALLDGISTVQGSLLYRGLNDWLALAPGVSGRFLQTQGAGADPLWAAAAGSGDFSTNTATSVADELVLFADGTGKLGKRSTGSGRPLLTSGVLSLAAINLASEVTGDLPFANLAQASAASRLLGRGSAGGAGDFQEITLHSTLLMNATALELGANARVRAVGITIDGGGSVITTGVKGFIEIPASGTITEATLLSTDASSTAGSIVIDVWCDTFANYPPDNSDSITASAPPTLSTANKSQDVTLTGWTTTLTAGRVCGFNVDSATTVTRVTLILLYRVD